MGYKGDMKIENEICHEEYGENCIQKKQIYLVRDVKSKADGNFNRKNENTDKD